MSRASAVIITPEVKCLWSSDIDGLWQTACKHVWEFFDGSPRRNGMRFCPFCGKPLRQRSYRGR